jgi:hypothetical protein
MTKTGLAPTATPVPTEATPEPLLNAKYVYDGDGNMVKSVVISTQKNTPRPTTRANISSRK